MGERGNCTALCSFTILMICSINATTSTRLSTHSALTVLVLVIGDLHIPIRSHDLPFKFKKLLVPGKIQQVLLTGNVCDGETLEWLRGICNGDVRAARGDWDDVRTYMEEIVIPSTMLMRP
jgi:hypothetical protein